jgi:hypothetical protein
MCKHRHTQTRKSNTIKQWVVLTQNRTDGMATHTHTHTHAYQEAGGIEHVRVGPVLWIPVQAVGVDANLCVCVCVCICVYV